MAFLELKNINNTTRPITNKLFLKVSSFFINNIESLFVLINYCTKFFGSF